MMPLPADTQRRDKVRVLILTDEMEVGGTQRQIVHMACALDRDLYEVKIAYFRNRSFLVDELEAAGISVTEITKNTRIDLRFVGELVKFLREERFDVIHCYAFSAEFWGAVGRRFLPVAMRPALITSVRGKYDWYSSLQWRIKRWTALQSIKIIANSHAGAEYALKKMRLERGAVDVVYNGVAEMTTVIRHEISGVTSTTPHPPTIKALYVGRLVEVKNISVLLRAMRKLQDGMVPGRLLIVGDGPLRKVLIDQVEALNLSNHVEFLGQRSDTQALMAAADFLVLPSFWEGLSNVILEAMMVGTPVIASAVGGSVELVEHMKTGLLFPSDDAAALADAMRCLATNSALRDRLGNAGRQRAVEQFSIAAMVRTMGEIYSRSVAPARPHNSVKKV